MTDNDLLNVLLIISTISLFLSFVAWALRRFADRLEQKSLIRLREQMPLGRVRKLIKYYHTPGLLPSVRKEVLCTYCSQVWPCQSIQLVEEHEQVHK